MKPAGESGPQEGAEPRGSGLGSGAWGWWACSLGLQAGGVEGGRGKAYQLEGFLEAGPVGESSLEGPAPVRGRLGETVLKVISHLWG